MTVLMPFPRQTPEIISYEPCKQGAVSRTSGRLDSGIVQVD